jgi:hypothetical protein
MPLGTAAMLLTFDIAPEAMAEHDHWHTHEHLPERLSIPGFLRGTRWVALQGQPRYLVLYEVESLDTLSSEAYLERLNHPTPWTAKMMPHYHGMTRGFCSVVASAGVGTGHVGLLARFKPGPGDESRLLEWLRQDILAVLPLRPGLGSVQVLRGAISPPMTREQRIRGADAAVDWALLATAYSMSDLAAVAEAELSGRRFADQGAVEVTTALYRMDYTLVASELSAAEH